jgi:transposase
VKKSMTLSDTPVIGLDLGDKRSHACVVDRARGDVLERFVVATTPPALRKEFSRWVGASVLIEAGTHSPWVSRLLESAGLRVTVANPNRLALISRSTRKTDRNDAETLALVGRSGLGLAGTVVHRSEERQTDLETLKARDALVRARTMLVNHVRCAVKASGARLSASDTSSFPRKVADEVPKALRAALMPLLATISQLTRRIRRYDARVRSLCEQYPQTELLAAIGGVGDLTSLAFLLVLGDAKRFKHSRDVGSYLGLCPRQAQSGDCDPQMRISKTGNGFMRRLLVQSAHYILGPFGEDCTLRRVGERLTVGGGKRAKKRAVVAVARRLAVMMHRLLTTGEVYDPLRDAPATAASAPA